MGRESPVCRGIGTPGRALTKVFTGRVTAGLLASRARVASARRGTGCLILTTKCWGVNGPTCCADHRSKRFGHSSIRLPCRGARGTKCWVFSGQGGAVVSGREALSPEGGTQGGTSGHGRLTSEMPAAAPRRAGGRRAPPEATHAVEGTRCPVGSVWSRLEWDPEGTADKPPREGRSRVQTAAGFSS